MHPRSQPAHPSRTMAALAVVSGTLLLPIHAHVRASLEGPGWQRHFALVALATGMALATLIVCFERLRPFLRITCVSVMVAIELAVLSTMSEYLHTRADFRPRSAVSLAGLQWIATNGVAFALIVAGCRSMIGTRP